MITILDRTLNNAWQSKDQTQNHNKQKEIHKTMNQQLHSHRLRTDSSISHGENKKCLTGIKASPSIVSLFKHKTLV